MTKKVNGSTIAVIVLLAVIMVGVLAILAAFLLPKWSNRELTVQEKNEAIQAARLAYRQHLQTYGSTEEIADYYFYEMDEDRVVSIIGGQPKEVYRSLSEAVRETVKEPDAEQLSATHTDKLYAYRIKIDLTKPDGDNVFSMLMIGNSFSADAIEYIADIAMSAGQQEVYLGNLYIGGCSLATHAQNAKSNADNYYYFLNKNGKWSRSTDSFPEDKKDHSILEAIQSHSWDYVCLQQVSGYSGDPSSYTDHLSYLINYVKKYAPNAKIVWHMTWAYQQDSTHPDFVRYNRKQQTMYNAIVSTVQDLIVPNEAFTAIIPAGTAVQNARTSYLGDTLTMDGYHMARPIGRYLVGLSFVRQLTDLNLEDVTFLPAGMTEEQKKIAIESVENAYQKPFEVTPSQYVEQP